MNPAEGMPSTTKVAAGAGYTVRPYRSEDEAAVLSLLDRSLGGGPAGCRPPEFFRWKHLDNPFGRSFMLVADTGSGIIGLRAFMRWRFVLGDRTVRAVRAVDTATDPDHQGRGVFSRLTREALSALSADTDVVFNTPNDKSLPGYLKMGWRVVGKVPVRVRVRRPMRFLAGIRTLRAGEAGPAPAVAAMAEPAAEALGDPRVDGLLRAGARAGGSIATDRDVGYLRWRYGSAPLLDYRAVRQERHGELRGLALFRVRPRGPLAEATVAEVLVPEGDVETAATLLRRVVRSAHVDHATAHFPPGSELAAAGTRAGFLPSPVGVKMVANPLRAGLRPDPLEIRSWALSLGDVEVF